MSKPAKCIPVSEARTLQNNWVATRAKDIEAAMGSEDTREFHFSVAELQEFLDYVTAESTKQGHDSPGVRIYFGAYDDANNQKATVFLAATEGDSSSSANNYNIEPMNRTQGGWPPKNY